MTGADVGEAKGIVHKNVLFFRDLLLSISEWCPFGQNSISSFNESMDSLKGIKSSLLTGKVDQAPDTSKFSIKPRFTRVKLDSFDRYNWIKFKASLEYPEEVEQVEELFTHVDKSGFINYGLKLEEVAGKQSRFSLDETSAIVADLVEDTSVMIDALLTQFQRRILKAVYGDTPFRPKFVAAMTTALMPERPRVEDYHDREDQENEINQLVGIAYKFVDLSPKEMLILGTGGMILITPRPEHFQHVTSFYSFVRGLQLFQGVFYNRLKTMWDMIRDLRREVLHIEREESINILEQKLSELSADIVLTEEIVGFMVSGNKDMQAIWKAHGKELDPANLALANHLDIEREVLVTGDKIVDMRMDSKGLVDEVSGLRDMVNTLAEKRMRDLSKLMTDNIQQGSEAQLAMAANVRASRYSGAALKILSMISTGALGMKISDLIMKALDEWNGKRADPIEVLGSDNFYGGYLQVIVGVVLWIVFTYVFFKLIKSSSAKMKDEKLAKDFVLSLRIPIDVRSTTERINKYLATKSLTYHNVELTGHRVSWYQKMKNGEDEAFYTMTFAFDPRNGHVHYIHANTEDKAGNAEFTTEWVQKELLDAGLITPKQDAYIRERMGFAVRKGVA
jgi:hypothetical protein